MPSWKMREQCLSQKIPMGPFLMRLHLWVLRSSAWPTLHLSLALELATTQVEKSLLHCCYQHCVAH
jgi:hypothetical protein